MGCNNSTSAEPGSSSDAPKAKPAAKPTKAAASGKSGSEATKYKLTYFNVEGRAELARLLFAEAGVEYVDNRIEFKDWPALKPTTPFGSLPLLEVEGHDQVFCQCITIARYLAHEFGLAGKDNLEQLHVDMVVSCIVELFDAGAALAGGNMKEEDKKIAVTEYDDKLNPAMDNLEKMVEGTDTFASSGLTYADIYFFVLLTWPKQLGLSINFDKCPKLKALSDMVAARPNIAKWVKERP